MAHEQILGSATKKGRPGRPDRKHVYCSELVLAEALRSQLKNGPVIGCSSGQSRTVKFASI